ncbi:MAG: phosphate ABC transporter permease PstA [Chloroflexi bacterium]|nr:phosphate ABC transporter permease PstA [Chloroflexota bacterium]MDQ3407136.1 phosphate ABC transporter permease PstA [Chloroflexota bacterium]
MTTQATSVPAAVVRRSLRSAGTDWRGVIFQGLLILSLVFSLSVLVVLLADVFSRGWPVLAARGMDFATAPAASNAAVSGAGQGIMGSVLIGVIVAIVAFPLGIATAIYLEEYAADNKLTRFITVNIRNLAGVPSIVFGLLGLAVFVGALKALEIGPGGNGRIVLAGGLTMATLVLPIVIITASEAIRAVPGAIREAGYGVGASRWQVVRQLILPSAAPGILTGVVLSLSRALGETAPLILAGAVLGTYSSGNQDFVEQLSGSYTALPMVIFNWTRQPSDDFRDIAAAAIIILLGVTLAANALAIYLRNRYERAW